jgi:uncharacterized protein YbaP (TraB family)
MRLLISGIVLTIAATAAFVFLQRPPADPPLGPERTTKAMVWKASRGPGKSTVWLCGSIHILRESDYPLPAPWRKAWDQSRRVVMELKPGTTEDPETQKLSLALSSLPDGQSLLPSLSPDTSRDFLAWCTDSNISPDSFQHMKPWMASLRVGMTSLDRLGFNVARGIERHLAARLGERSAEGLESVSQSLGILDSLSSQVQDLMLRHALADAKSAPTRITLLANAWHEGDTATLDRLLRDGFKDFPSLRQRLIDDRNKAWFPRILQLLDGDEESIVIVGAGHLSGPDSLISMLEAQGVSVSQQEYTTRRLAPPP